MKSIFTSIVLFFSFNFLGLSQNVISNGSAEILYGCPIALNQIDSAYFWSKGSLGTPDLYSSCNGLVGIAPPNIFYGYQKPRTGGSVLGLLFHVNFSWPNSYTMYKEYPKIEFSQPLVSNVTYNVRVFLSNSGVEYINSNSVTGDSLGFLFLFNDIVYNTSSNIPHLPQLWDTSGFYIDTANWIEVGGQYTAQGGEKYLIIGDFKRYDLIPNYYITTYVGLNASTSTYYYLDDVAIWPADTIPPPANAGQDTTICRGGKAKLGTHNYPDYIYEWSPSNTLSNDSGGIVWAYPDTTTTYYLQVTDDIYTKTMDSITVYINNCGQNDTLVCIKQPFTMGSTNYPFWNYQWSPSTGLISDTVGMPLCIPLSNQSYQLLITTNSGDTIAMDSTTVTVGSCYYANAGIDRLICKGDSIQIGTQNYSFINYSWSPDYMISDTATGTPIVWPDTTMYYYLQLTDTMGNITMDSVKISVQTCIGIKEIYPFENGVRVYPNPASSQITIEFEQNPKKDFQVLLYDVTGKIIINKLLLQENDFTIDISNLNKGFYIVTIKEENKVLITKKFMKN